jgi:hypothetical protein
MEISIHIHEDDWGMRNLYPLAAMPEAAADVREASEAGARSLSPNGIGWTDVHQIQEPSVNYTSVGLRLQDAVSSLESLMPHVQKFTATATAGFDPKVQDAWGRYDNDAYCYGFDASCFIKLDNEGDLVKSIWFECRTQDAERVDTLRCALLAINHLIPSGIADYWIDMAGAIEDVVFLDRYFREITCRGQ